ncbi:hypothetical protein MNBD_GAMMA17-817 [hydrothermal vent metagenome]|uniref:FIG139438: lipoprotein B n=1 Tax=hydrothermal vent metagenome TaxID=652676 RepID=A0A3B0ZDE1_9ZZZZ
MVKKRSIGRRIMDWIVLHGRQRYSIFVLSAVSVGDFFIPALPTQTSVIALGLLQPGRVVLIVTAFAMAAVVGAGILMAILLSIESYLSSVQPDVASELYDEWLWVQEIVREYGLWGLLAFSMFPTPPRLMVATTVLAGFSAPLILTTVFIGKIIWFGLVVMMLRFAPGLFMRIPVLGIQLKKLQELYSEKTSL